jgi:hypothetical protein
VIDTRLDINSSDTNIKTDWPTALDVGIRPEVLTSVATVSNNIVDGGKMTFVGRLTDTTSHLVALIHVAVSSTPLSFLSDMLPAMSAPETVSAPHLRSSAAPSATPIAAFSLVESTTPSNRKLPSTFEHDERAVTVSGLNGTRSRESGGVLLRFLKSLLSSILTTKPANGGNHTRIMPLPWSARPMAFARYARPRVQAPGGRQQRNGKTPTFSGSKGNQGSIIAPTRFGWNDLVALSTSEECCANVVQQPSRYIIRHTYRASRR